MSRHPILCHLTLLLSFLSLSDSVLSTTVGLPFTENLLDQTLNNVPGGSGTRSHADINKILVVDSAVEDYQTIVDTLDRNIEVHFLNADRDGISQISELLQGRKDIDVLHIISHGNSGEVLLGNASLTANNIDSYQGQLQSWGSSLSESADILIYGCKVGQNGEFVTDIAVATGADVAASDDLTGAEILGGDWTLEKEVGSVEAVTLNIGNYSGVLALGDPAQTATFGTSSALITAEGDDPSAINVPNSGFDVTVTTNGASTAQITAATHGGGAGLSSDGSDMTLIISDAGLIVSYDQISFSSNNGAFFKLSSMAFVIQTVTGPHSITFTGHKSNGAALGTLTASFSHDVITSLDFTSPTSGTFEDIDEIRITPASNTAVMHLYFDDIVTDAAVSPNNAPVNTLPSSPTVNEDDISVAIADDINIADADGDSQTMTLTFTGGTGTLPTGTLTGFTTGDGTNDASMVFTGTVAGINTALDGLTFTPTPDLNGTNAGAIRMQLNDGNSGTDDDTIQFNIVASNDAPVNTLPSSPAVNEDDVNVAIADDINIADADGDSQTMTLTFTGGTGTLPTGTLTGFTTGNGTNDVTMVFTGTVAGINTALDGLTYTPTPDLSGTNVGAIRMQLNDGNSGTDDDTIQFTIVASNDAPVNTLPSSPTVNEDDVNVAIADNINIADADGDNQTMALTFTGGTGTLPTGSLGGFTAGVGTNDVLMIFTGTIAGINTALDGLTFTPTPGLNGTNAGAIRMQLNDGNSGTDDDTIQFDIVVGNDAPVNTLPSSPTVNEDDVNVAIANNINIADADGDNQTMTLTFTGGTGTLPVGGLTSVTTGDGSDDALMVFTGTVAAINTALDSLTFTPTPDLNGTNAGAIRMQLNDGNGGTDDDSIQFDIVSINDAPVNTLPSSPTVNEDDVNVAIANDINIADVDGDSQTMTLTFTGGTGTLPTGTLAGFTTGDGTNDAMMVFTGTVTGINTALDGLTFTPTPDLSGTNAGAIRMQLNDGNGGTDDDTIQFNIAASNDAPVNTLPSSPAVNEDDINVAIANDINIADADGDNQTMTLTFTGGTGTLPVGGLTSVTTGDGSDDALMVFTGTVAAINTALDSLTFTPTPDLSGTNAGAIRMQLNDGNSGADDDTIQFNIVASNDAPVNTLPSSPSVNEDDTNVAIANDINIADADGDNQTMTLTFTGGTGTLPTGTLAGFTTGDGTNDAAMVFTGTVTGINTALDGLTFTPTPNLSGTNAGAIRMQLNDGNSGTDDDTIQFNIGGDNDAPVNTLPSSPSVNEDDTNVAIANNINIADSDGDSQTMTLTFTGGTGTLPIESLVGFTRGDGTNDATMVFTGSVTGINTALDGLTFTPTPNLSGSNAGAIRMQLNDGNNGTDDDTLPFNIVARNDAPVNTLPSSPTVNEDDTNVAIANDINVADADGDNQIMTLTFAGGTGTLPTGTLAGFTTGDGTNDAAMVFTGTVTGINSALDGLTFTPTPNLSGTNAGAIRMQLNDGNNGTDDDTIQFNIGAGNDAPTITGTPVSNAVEGVAYSFTLSSSDIDTAATLSYQIANNPSWMFISGSAVVGTPGSSDVGITNNIVVSVTDGTNSTSLPAFSVTVDSDLDSDGDGDATDPDIDGDGMSNSFEIANGLDPLDASDAVTDLDGDGTSNLEEFTNNSDPTFDDYSPTITLDSVVTIDAVALLTDLPSNLATASDGLDGDVPVSHDLPSGFLEPGVHTITWSAVDAVGNSTSETQILNVRPLASWQVDQETGEGNTVSVTLYLNGEAPTYPVVANYTVSGSATNPADHDAVSGSLTINGGQSASVDVVVASDVTSESDEIVIFTLDSISNAALGVQEDHQITISEVNHAPTVTLSAALDSAPDTPVTLLDSTSGVITVTASIIDVDSGDNHTTTWTAKNGLSGTASNTSYSFDSSVVGAGTYQISVTSEDDAASSLRGTAVITLTILDQALSLSSSTDSDGDGVIDSTEGSGDSDGDNVPDFADALDEKNVLAIFPVGGEPNDGAWFLEAQPGLSLQLNVYSSASGDYSPLLEDGDIVDGNAADRSDTEYEYTSGIFDFVVSNMPVQGETVFVVMPQLSAIPANAIYRKEINGRWGTFEEDANNILSSAPGDLGICPPPGSTEYVPGLTEGHFCVQLGIEDGGANDADGEANGSIIDPGGVSVALFTSVSVSTGGGAITWPALLLMSLVALGRIVGVSVLMLGLSRIAHASDWLKDSYITMHVGLAESNVNSDEVQAEFNGAGVTNTTINEVDSRRKGFGLGVGCSLTPNWGVELTYLDLKQVEVDLTSTQVINNLDDVMPESGDGFTLSVLHRYPLDEKANVRFRLGLFDWQAEYNTPVGANSQVGSTEQSGTDWYAGFGLDHKITDRLNITVELQHFDFDRDNTTYFRLGLEWRLDYDK